MKKLEIYVGAAVIFSSGLILGAFLAVFVIEHYLITSSYAKPVRQAPISSHELRTTHGGADTMGKKLQPAANYFEIQAGVNPQR